MSGSPMAALDARLDLEQLRRAYLVLTAAKFPVHGVAVGVIRDAIQAARRRIEAAERNQSAV